MDEKEKIREQGEAQCLSNRFMQYNHISLAAVEKDFAAVELTVVPESCNPYGLIHGGAIYTLADNATGAAAHSDGRYYVTQTSALHFLRNQATGTVRASAWVRHRGKSTVLTAVDITGEGGRLLATGEFTFFCVDKALMDQKAGAEQK